MFVHFQKRKKKKKRRKLSGVHDVGLTKTVPISIYVHVLSAHVL